MNIARVFIREFIATGRGFASDASAYISRSRKHPAILLFTTLFVIAAGFSYKVGEANRDFDERMQQTIKPYDQMRLEGPHLLKVRKALDELQGPLDELNVFMETYPIVSISDPRLLEQGIQLAGRVKEKSEEINALIQKDQFRYEPGGKLFERLASEWGVVTEIADLVQGLYDIQSHSATEKIFFVKYAEVEFARIRVKFDRLQRTADDTQREAAIFQETIERDSAVLLSILYWNKQLNSLRDLAIYYMMSYIALMGFSFIRFFHRRSRRRLRRLNSKVSVITSAEQIKVDQRPIEETQSNPR